MHRRIATISQSVSLNIASIRTTVPMKHDKLVKTDIPSNEGSGRQVEEFGLIACVAADRLSRNLFPNELSRNYLLDMEKWDAPQTRVCVTIAGPVRSWAIHVTQPVTRSMRRKGSGLAYDSEHPLTGPREIRFTADGDPISQAGTVRSTRSRSYLRVRRYRAGDGCRAESTLAQQ